MKVLKEEEDQQHDHQNDQDKEEEAQMVLKIDFLDEKTREEEQPSVVTDLTASAKD